MREEEEDEKKNTRNDVPQKNGTRKEEAHYRIYFVSERWFAAYPGAQKNRASSSSTIKSNGAKEEGGVNYGNHEFSVTETSKSCSARGQGIARDPCM